MDNSVNGNNQQEMKEKILSMVAEYCNTFHNKKPPFEPGQRIPYASRVYDADEMVNLVDSSLEFWLTSGRYTDQFEKDLANYLCEPGCFCHINITASRRSCHQERR